MTATTDLKIDEPVPYAPTEKALEALAEKPKFQMRFDTGKRKIATLAPLGALEAISNASEVGLVKYWRDGYREDGGYTYQQCLNSAARHIFLRTGGQKYDTDGSAYLGRPIDHLDMAIWNLSAACENRRLYGDDQDDLWRGPGTVMRGVPVSPEEAERLSLADLRRRVEQFLPKMRPEHRSTAEALIDELATKVGAP